MCLTNIENSLRTWDVFLRIVITSFLQNPLLAATLLKLLKLSRRTLCASFPAQPYICFEAATPSNAVGTFLQEPIESELQKPLILLCRNQQGGSIRENTYIMPQRHS